MEFSKLKVVVFTLSLMLCSIASQAQTYAEFFRQKRTQTKYLLEQIAALQVYTGFLKKGYNIVNNGLNTVKGFTKGEFDLHHAFISSLKKVNPLIRNSSKIADIITLQLEISKAFNHIRQSNLSNPTISTYVEEVRANLMEECNVDLDELLLVITSGKIEMKDDERLKRLDKIYNNMLDKSAFVQSFCNQVNLVNLQRAREQKTVNELKQLYGNEN